MRRIRAALVAAAGWAWLLAAAGAWAGEPPKVNVILIGWDGAQREHVQECLARNELPNLKRLSDQGALVDINVKGKTDTKAGWTEILTGCGPEVTGVYSNGRYQPIPEGLTIFERLRQHFGADQIATVAVIGKKRHCGEIDPPKKVRLDGATSQSASGPAAGGRKQRPGGKAAKQADEAGTTAPASGQAPGARRRARGAAAGRAGGVGRRAGAVGAGAAGAGAGQQRAQRQPAGRIVEEGGVKYRLSPGSPYYITHRNVDEWHFGLMQDQKVGAEALELLEKYKDRPFFFFVHFAEVDHSGHKAGENSKPYDDALISADTWTGRIMDKLKELKLDGKTVVYVTADHGFDEGRKGHRNAPTVFLGTTDPQVKQAGGRADVAATILARFGLDLSKLTPPLAGRPLSQASASAPAPAATAK